MKTRLWHALLLGLGLVAIMGSHSPAWADGHHEESEQASLHRPRHGGMFGDADDLYHYEAVRTRDQRLILYVMDDESRPLDARTLTGRWTVHPDSTTPIAGAFESEPRGAFLVAPLPSAIGTEDPLAVKVEVRKGESWVGMEFALPYPPAIPLHWQLGFLAGITIFLGLPIAALPQIQNRTRAFLNALSTGILVFLLVEILGKVLEGVEEAVEHAAAGSAGLLHVLSQAGLLVLGVGLGLLGLVWFERRFIAASARQPSPVDRARSLALMIALGIGIHNFGEGLAIGQEHMAGAARLALLLAIGFGLHNAAEGFGIAAPLAGHRARLGFLGILGMIGGLPTVLGAILGGVWTSPGSELFCLSLAGGTILYVIGELLHVGRQLKSEVTAHVGLLMGFFIAFATELLIHLAH